MRGSVQGKRGAWSFVIDNGTDPKTGKRRQHHVRGFAKKEDAQNALTAALAEMNAGTFVKPTRGTFGGFLVDRWLPGIATTVRPTTLDSYRRMVDGHLVPRLGAVELSALTASQLNVTYADMLAGGRKSDGSPLSTRTVRLAHVTAHRALRDAVRWGLIARNPADLADPPAETHREMRYWSPDQLRAFLTVVAGERLGPLIVLAATTAMRRGELCGLRWVDVDLDGRRLSVTQASVVAGHKVITSAPKTPRSRRTIALDGATVATLRGWRKAQLEQRLVMGAGWAETGLVFTSPTGEAVHPNVVTRTFARLAASAGLPAIRFHDLRHSWATAALGAGIPAKVVSERLGHSSISITMDVYSHVLPGLDEHAAETVAAVILSPVVTNP